MPGLRIFSSVLPPITSSDSSCIDNSQYSSLVHAYDKLLAEVASLKSQLAVIQNQYISSTPVLAILDYTYGFEKKDGTEIYAGNIHFQEVTITTDPDKNRLWHFRWGGEIVANKFNTVFQFNPETTVPIGNENVKITQLNFDSAFYPGEQEYIQGHITVNNQAIDVSYMKKVLDFQWDAVNAKMTLSFNLTNWNPHWETLLNWVQVNKQFDPMTYKDDRTTLLAPNGANSIHVEMAMRDGTYTATTTLLFDTLYGWTSGSYSNFSVYLNSSRSNLITTMSFTLSSSGTISQSFSFTAQSSASSTNIYLTYGSYTPSFGAKTNTSFAVFLINAGILITQNNNVYTCTLNAFSTYGWTNTSNSYYQIKVYSDSAYNNLYKTLSLTASTSSSLTITYPSSQATLYLKYGTYTTSFTPTNNGSFKLFLLSSSIAIMDYSLTLNAFSTYGWTNTSNSYYEIKVYLDSAYTIPYPTSLFLTASTSSTLTIYYPSSQATLYLKYNTYTTSFTPSNAGTFAFFIYNAGLLVTSTSNVYSCKIYTGAYSAYSFEVNKSYSILIYTDSSHQNLYQTWTFTTSYVSDSYLTIYYPSQATLYLKYNTYTTSFTPVNNTTYNLYYSAQNSGTFNVTVTT
jgi:hypothetical protein